MDNKELASKLRTISDGNPIFVIDRKGRRYLITKIGAVKQGDKVVSELYIDKPIKEKKNAKILCWKKRSSK